MIYSIIIYCNIVYLFIIYFTEVNVLVIKSVKLNLIRKLLLFLFVIFLVLILVYFGFNNFRKPIGNATPSEDFPSDLSNVSVEEIAKETEQSSKNYIKWVEFNGSATLLKKLSNLDIASHNNENSIKLNWIELMAYLGCKYGGNLKLFNQSDLDKLVSELNSGKTMEELTSNMKLYNYFYQSYDAIFHEFIGDYEIETSNNSGNKSYTKKYGLKAFLPIAKNYSFSHYKDFGSSRSYGYRRVHLGNDLLGSIGTPVIAVESGYIEALGWNPYGGWRVGIRSFDKKRYYYYAHLRKDHPYSKDLVEGQIVSAGDVIGYLGMTGYSTKENVNNINIPHLHFGMQLIFNEVQKEGSNQIWIDVYEIIEFLRANSSSVYMAYDDTKDFERKFELMPVE